MPENSGGQSNSTEKPHPALAKSIPLRAIAGVLVIVGAVGGLWLAFKRDTFARAWTNLRGLPNSPSWDWWMGALFAMLGLLGVLILWKVPQWQVAHVEGLKPKDRFDKQNEARKTLATILGGVAFFVTALFTWQNFKLTQEGQITDRYTKAIEQLGAVDSTGNTKLQVRRLGAIYSLEAIANESSAFHWPVMEVLCTYVRMNAPAVEEQPDQNPAPVANQKSPNKPTTPQEQQPRADVLAILTVLGRRNASYERSDQALDLSKTNLGGADLHELHLDGADLTSTHFERASLAWTHLEKADLTSTYLQKAILRGARLNGAIFKDAHLDEVELDLAHLEGVDLSSATGLKQEQVNVAKGSADTKLPSGLCLPKNWTAVGLNTPNACPAAR